MPSSLEYTPKSREDSSESEYYVDLRDGSIGTSLKDNNFYVLAFIAVGPPEQPGQPGRPEQPEEG